MIRKRRFDAVRPRTTGAGDFAKDMVAIRDTPETDGDGGAPEGTVIYQSAALQRRPVSARKRVASPCRKHHTLAIASTSRASRSTQCHGCGISDAMVNAPTPAPATNVVQAPQRHQAQPPGPCAMVIFGARRRPYQATAVPRALQSVEHRPDPRAFRHRRRRSRRPGRGCLARQPAQDAAELRRQPGQRKSVSPRSTTPPGSGWPTACPTCRAT